MTCACCSVSELYSRCREFSRCAVSYGTLRDLGSKCVSPQSSISYILEIIHHFSGLWGVEVATNLRGSKKATYDLADLAGIDFTLPLLLQQMLYGTNGGEGVAFFFSLIRG